MRRHRLSEETNNIEYEERYEARQRKTTVEQLREQLKEKDLEVQSMRDGQELASQLEEESGATVTRDASLSTKVRKLEQEIQDLKAELERKESIGEDDPNWTMAARDPYDFEHEDEQMITNDDQDFTMNDEIMTTPTRLNTSFPSPPSTMPNTPSTPCRSRNVSAESAGTQISFPDTEKSLLKSQLQDLQAKILKLNAAVVLNDDNTSRLATKLSDFIPATDTTEQDHTAVDSALDTVLTQLALSQYEAREQEQAFSALTTEIKSLGFSAASPDQALEAIATQFRQARLDLEYLTPGEVEEGFENEKLLGMLISRIKVLVEMAKSNDDNIDQYHEQEVLLRQQIDTRVSAMDEMRRQLNLAEDVVGGLREEITELSTGNSRLKTALESYRSEVKTLESLISRTERAGREVELQLRSEAAIMQGKLRDEALLHDVTKADNEGKDVIIAELDRRLKTAFAAAEEVQSQLASLTSSTSSAVSDRQTTISSLQITLTERERAHGDALALRDARVSELREEIERVNDALKTAYGTIVSLRKENRELAAQIEGEKKSSQFVVKSMLDQLRRLEQTGEGWMNGGVEVVGPAERVAASAARGEGSGNPAVEESSSAGVVVRKGGLFDGGAATSRRLSKKRRRYDSGLGFLEEDDEGEILGSDL